MDCELCAPTLAKLASAEARVAELEADKRRLDWLDEQKPKGWEQVLFEYDENGFAAVNFCQGDYDDDAQFYCGDDWRAAIDAAMEGEGE